MCVCILELPGYRDSGEARRLHFQGQPTRELRSCQVIHAEACAHIEQVENLSAHAERATAKYAAVDFKRTAHFKVPIVHGIGPIALRCAPRGGVHYERSLSESGH